MTTAPVLAPSSLRAPPDDTRTAAAPERPEVIAERSGSTFLWPMLLLPRRKRHAMFAIYAFCRQVDDVVDLPGPPEAKHAGLAAWRERVQALYRGDRYREDAPPDDPVKGKPIKDDPVSEALRSAIEHHALPRAELEAVIDGMAMDLAGTMRAPSLEMLQLYCRRVAGAVGLLAIRVFGRPEAETFAIKLGEALQLTNILRDLTEDARLDRLYLPREVLDAAGIAESVPAAVLAHPNLPLACDALATLAETRYNEAVRALPAGSARTLWAAHAMMVLYHRMLMRLRAQGWRNPDIRVRIRKREQIWVAARCAIGLPPAL